MALAWVLRDPRVTSALIGASRPERILDNVKAVRSMTFDRDEMAKIDGIRSSVLLPPSLWTHE